MNNKMVYKHLDIEQIKSILERKGIRNIDVTEDIEIKTESIWEEYNKLGNIDFKNMEKFFEIINYYRLETYGYRKIAIVVDSDVDGLAFASMMTRLLIKRVMVNGESKINYNYVKNIDVVFTEKFETRGLRSLLKFKDYHGENNKEILDNADVIIVGDMGTNELIDLVPYAEKGKEIVVIDHHTPGNNVNLNVHKNITLINPYQAGCINPSSNMSATHILYELLKTGNLMEEETKYVELVPLANMVDGTLGLPESRTYIISVYGTRRLVKGNVISDIMERRFTNTRIIMPSHIGENVGSRLNYVINNISFGIAYNLLNREYGHKVNSIYIEEGVNPFFDYYDYKYLDKCVDEYKKYRAELTDKIINEKILIDSNDVVIVEGFDTPKDKLLQTTIISQLSNRLKKMVLIIGFYGMNNNIMIGGSYRHYNNNSSALKEINKLDMKVNPIVRGHDNAGGYLAKGFKSKEEAIEHLQELTDKLQGNLHEGLDENKVEYTLNIREFYTTHSYKEYKELIAELKFLANVLQRHRIQLNVRFEDIVIDNVFEMKGNNVRIDSHRHTLQLPFFNATKDEIELIRTLNTDLTYNYITVEGSLSNNVFAQGSKGKLRSKLQVIPTKFELKTITGMHDRKIKRFTSEEWFEHLSKKYNYNNTNYENTRTPSNSYSSSNNSITRSNSGNRGSRLSFATVRRGLTVN